ASHNLRHPKSHAHRSLPAAAMGSTFSHEDAPPPPSPAPADAPPLPYAPMPPPPLPPQEEDKAAEDDKVDYLNLRCPIPYEEAQREASMTLKPDVFEGFRFDFVKPVSQVLFLSHSASMGSMEVPSQGPEVIKVPTSQYEFGANYIDPKVLFCQVKFMRFFKNVFII
uniref:Uncharacterized protein n=1 Tax=Aegilops tauschii subsp. strangulata TaxID=200361 RepID=A0A453ER04_AEGTS